MSADKPSTSPMLAMLEPTTLPMAREGRLLNEASAETTISGAEVPKPMMVSPIMGDGITIMRASEDEPATTRTADFISTTKPATSFSRAMKRVIIGQEGGRAVARYCGRLCGWHLPSV